MLKKDMKQREDRDYEIVNLVNEVTEDEYDFTVEEKENFPMFIVLLMISAPVMLGSFYLLVNGVSLLKYLLAMIAVTMNTVFVMKAYSQPSISGSLYRVSGRGVEFDVYIKSGNMTEAEIHRKVALIFRDLELEEHKNLSLDKNYEVVNRRVSNRPPKKIE